MAKSISIEPSTYLSSNISTKEIPYSSNTSSWRRFLRRSLLQIFRSSNSQILLPTLGYLFWGGEHYLHCYLHCLLILKTHGCTMDWELPGLHCPIIHYLGGRAALIFKELSRQSSTLKMIYQSLMVKIGGKTCADQHVGGFLEKTIKLKYKTLFTHPPTSKETIIEPTPLKPTQPNHWLKLTSWSW